MLCIELERPDAKEESWEAILWHSGVNGEWTELPLKHLTNAADVRIARRPNMRGPKSLTDCCLAQYRYSLGSAIGMQLPFLHIVDGVKASTNTVHIAVPS